MKTIKFYMTLFLLTILGINATGQQPADWEIVEKLPRDIKFKDELQKYQVTTDHFNGDIFGNFYNKLRITGEYTRGTWIIRLTRSKKDKSR